MRRSLLLVGLAACGFSGGGSAIDGANGSGSGSGSGSGPQDAPTDGTLIPDGGPGRAKAITIHGTKIAGNHTGLPVWLDITDTQLGARADVAGDDIFFTDSGGAAIPYQITAWTKSSSHLQAWVLPPSLSAGTDTTLYLRYGDPTIAPAPAPAAVFANHFAGVWHLDDALANTTIADATGTNVGMANHLAAPAAVAGVLGGGIQFNGNDSIINITNPFTGTAAKSSHTISAWVIAGAETKFGAVVVLGKAMPDQARWLHLNFSGLSVGFYGGDWYGAGTAITNSTHLVHWVYDAPSQTSTVYVDGAPLASHKHDFSPASDITTTGAAGAIGNAAKEFGPGGNTPPANDGVLDEVRIATVTRNANWVATEYANQHDPQSFYSVGPEQ